MRSRRHFTPSIDTLPFRIVPSEVTVLSTIIGGAVDPGAPTDPGGTGVYYPGCVGVQNPGGGAQSSNSPS